MPKNNIVVGDEVKIIRTFLDPIRGHVFNENIVIVSQGSKGKVTDIEHINNETIFRVQINSIEPCLDPTYDMSFCCKVGDVINLEEYYISKNEK